MRQPFFPCHSVFVYGTLMRGQERAGCWPHPPRRVTVARTRGILFDLGEYPALVLGDGWVMGELWEMDEQHVPETLESLDEVEGVPELYVRSVAEVYGEGSFPTWAYLYLYHDLSQVGADRIPVGSDGMQRWTPR